MANTSPWMAALCFRAQARSTTSATCSHRRCGKRSNRRRNQNGNIAKPTNPHGSSSHRGWFVLRLHVPPEIQKQPVARTQIVHAIKPVLVPQKLLHFSLLVFMRDDDRL